jgi:hypothetical protein
MSAVQSQIMFRPARSEAELEKLLRLRYQVFNNDDDVRPFLIPNAHEIDMDAYDVNAHHVGLFRGDDPIGAARLITLRRGPQAEWVESVAVRHRGLPLQGPTERPLPVLGYTKDIYRAWEWLLNRGGEIVEASRLSLAAEHRSYRLAHFFADALVSYSLFAGFDAALVNARVAHTRMWQSVGFRTAPGTREYHRMGVQFNVLVVVKDWLPQEKQEILSSMTGRFQRDGHLLAA